MAKRNRLASLLAAVIDEERDDPQNPGEVRLEQARRLLEQWSSSQGSLIAAVAEVLNIKQGNCVRCDEAPCSKCGRDNAEASGG